VIPGVIGKDIDDLFVDKRGRIRLDVRVNHHTCQIYVRVKRCDIRHDYAWYVGAVFNVEKGETVFATRAERRRVLTAYADIVAIKLGHEYQLRSKL
jgi:hypothetical protein